MRDNVGKFFDLLAKDAALQAELDRINAGYAGRELSAEELERAAEKEILPLAARTGLAFTAEEWAAYSREPANLENAAISDDELEAVTGGAKCACMAAGGGKRSTNARTGGVDKPCGCVVAGGGNGYDDDGKKIIRCYCGLGGGGHEA